jgi:parallel beta-helix repeat protein
MRQTVITRSSFNRLPVPALVCALSLAVGCGDASKTVPTAPGLMADGGSAVLDPAAARSVIRVPGDFSTIQAAVDAATAGDTIRVASGVYCEQVSIVGKSDLRLHSPAGANRAVITGDCSTVNRLGAGIHVMNATGIEIQGFVVEYFEYGIQLMSVHSSRLHLNESRFNETVVRPGVAAGTRGYGILLGGSGHNTISQNDLHENGRNGILLNGSSGNTVRGNRLRDNNLDNLPGTWCNLMLMMGSNDNVLAENEVVGAYGVGIMIGPGVATGNRVEQNRVHGFAGPGIIAMASVAGNVIEQNDARGNGLSYVAPQNVDVFDLTQPTDNTWNRNLGSCGPGVC